MQHENKGCLEILPLTTDHSNIENQIVHIGANDPAKQKSKIQRNDFRYLIRIIENKNVDRRAGHGDENYSRQLKINK